MSGCGDSYAVRNIKPNLRRAGNHGPGPPISNLDVRNCYTTSPVEKS
jgi:hypothetical protein